MLWISKWALPVAMLGIGIAVLSGVLLPQLPAMSGLRMMIGLVAILLGIHRFAASRSVRVTEPRRRFGGERNRPWENHDEEK